MKKIIKLLIIFFVCSTIILAQTGTWRIVDSLKIYSHGSPYPIAVYSIAIDCADTLNCAIAERYNLINPLVRTSNNSGESWNISMIDTVSKPVNKIYLRPNEISYPDTSLCIVVCDAGFYYISRDKCRSWEKSRLDTNSLINAHFLNKNIGGIVGYYNYFMTTDGGNNWTNIYKNDLNISKEYIPDLIEYVYYQKQNKIYLLCFRYNFDTDYYIVSEDGGLSWKFLFKSPDRIRKFIFLDDNIAIAVGAKGKNYSSIFRDVIYKSTDGGYSWELKLDTLTKGMNGLYQVYFSDKKNGVALSTFWDLWRTSDGGDSWFQDTSYYNPKFVNYGVDVALLGSIKKFLMVNELNGYVIKYSEDGINNVNDDKPLSVSNLRIYPNIISSGESLKIELNTEKQGIYNLQVYNSIGSVIDYYEFYSYGDTYSLEYLPPAGIATGQYFIMIKVNNQFLNNNVFIIQ